MKDTQQTRLLTLLQIRGSKGVYVYEMMAPRPEGLGIAQYNARIKELREDGYNIINTNPGHFVLQESSVVQIQQDLVDIGEKLKQLRKDWTVYKRKGDIGRMKLVEGRAKMLKSYTEDQFIKDAQQALL